MTKLSFHVVAVLLALAGQLTPANRLEATPLFTAPFYGSDVGLFPKAVVGADFNEDGQIDLVVANIRTTASVLLGRGDGTFPPQREVAAGQFPSSVATGDLNGDGHQDLIFASSDSVYVLLGNGDGTFRDKRGFRAGFDPFSVAVGDLNGDGKLDVVVGDPYSRTVVVLLGNGDGTLGLDVHYGSGLYAYALSLTDVTHDGHLDVVAVDLFTNKATVFPGNGDGSLATGQEYDVGVSPQSLAIGDLNGDGFPDVVTGNSASNSVSLLLGRADETFAPHVDIATNSWPGPISLGDLNGDSHLDLVIAGGTYSHAQVYLGRGDATFTLARDFPTAIGPTAQLLADVNGDGQLDLVEIDSNHIVVVHPGNGDGSFGSVSPVSTGGVDATAIATGDLDGDGWPDLVVAGFEASTIAVLRGRGDGTFGPLATFDLGEHSASMALADLNGDHKLDLILGAVSSIAVFIGRGDGTLGSKATYPMSSFSPSLVLADVNGDGKLDIVASEDAGVAVLLGKGDGTFGQTREFAAGISPNSVTVGDFNRDGFLDLAVGGGGEFSTGAGPTSVAILLGAGDGTFGQPQELVIPGACTGIVSGDFNGDGAMDLAVSDGSNVSLTGKAIWVALGRGDGTFSGAVGYGAGGYAQGIIAADLDGDGRLDLAVGASRTIYVFTGSGSGTFTAEGHYGAGGSAAMALCDVNLDGRPDLIAPHDFFDTRQGVDVLLNRRGIPDLVPARTFTMQDQRVIPVRNGGPPLGVYIEPIQGDFALSSIDPATIVMGTAGGGLTIHGVPGKGSVLGDADRNGIPELRTLFAREDIGTLFNQSHGRKKVDVFVEGALGTGRRFHSSLELTVVNTGRGSGIASVSPNPINPEGVLTFYTSKPGPLRVRLFDLSGRLIKTLVDAPALPAGSHDVRIDGRSSHGEPLATGIYFYEIDGTDGSTTGKLTILK